MFQGLISNDLAMIRGWFTKEDYDGVEEGNFELNRNSVNDATVEKTYTDENWKDSGKIDGLFNDYYKEFKSLNDDDDYSDISFKATQLTNHAYLLFVIEDEDALIYVQNESSQSEKKKVFVSCQLKAQQVRKDGYVVSTLMLYDCEEAFDDSYDN